MSYDGDDDVHESRRNTTLAIGVAVAAVAMVGLLYWLFSNMSGPALAVSPAAATTSTTTSGTAAPAPSQTSETAPPTIASWTPTTTFSLPPPEQPTMTLPLATRRDAWATPRPRSMRRSRASGAAPG